MPVESQLPVEIEFVACTKRLVAYLWGSLIRRGRPEARAGPASRPKACIASLGSSRARGIL